MSEVVKSPVVVRRGQLSDETAQSDGAQRLAGVSSERTGATQIWLGEVTTGPLERSVPHHHGDAETAGYVLRGKARIYFGEGYTEVLELEAGDFLFVPPNFPHIEENASSDSDLVWLTARSPDNVVVNLPDVELPK